MFDIKDLYQEIIVDHNRNPRNFGIIDNADKIIEGFNPRNRPFIFPDISCEDEQLLNPSKWSSL